MKTARLVILVMTLTIVTACTSGGGFVSVDQKFGRDKTASGFHLVREGETLYSIAWRYGLDYRELANANSISTPHTIYPGQKIDIDYTAAEAASAPRVSVRNPSNSPTPVAPAKVSKPKNGQISPKPVPTGPVSDWLWPSDGKIIGQFSTRKPVNKGIDLAGSMGESILAAAAGTVVYAGTGLRGYGNLVIIRHNEKFLSAYAHASRITVSEGQEIKAGGKIAEKGSTGTDKVKLHFEIRENGKPVNPLKYLPKRRGGG
ncbi:peptidoglycan DD-metalloendopeptidase family protein [Thalassolituus sp. UBA3500]|uniref:peptidoglycan DD-metalloendopeptidase family protein n=1 Tax=Thalassolituus sp. UBA3500 TaxID=1947664 RepID=UPI000B66659F|nr:peptidoglycan DD-metalloendopeptidase family protein [Thalassolituus sp. UBA3500]MBN56728.1 peptidase M23 [Oceanospirillaceae bacterium]OUX66178.1 MAG: peptidase M23 [Oceanospirillaceae bacterium TMED276]|tara:strand:- start:5254 stop:6030 length:777 start_codon:yes stop_codon:yes gene_type:complete